MSPGAGAAPRRMPAPRRVVIVGGGITGLTVAADLLERGVAEVTVHEADDRLGGKIRTGPFAGLPAVDEGPDAFLVRVPEAVALADELGLGQHLTSPTGASAAVWHPGRRGRSGPDSLHPIPDGLVLGVPAAVGPLARSRLISWRGKVRAGIEPLLPRTATDHDELGRFVRARFGHEVHERLVDALVGSIYAGDTDHTSLRSVPQLAALADRGRSLLLAARSMRRSAPPSGEPLFAAPVGGMGSMVDALADRIRRAGGTITTGSRVTGLEPVGDRRRPSRWRVTSTAGGAGDVTEADAVVLATPARATAPMLTEAAPDAAALLASLDHAGVVLVTLAVPGDTWPAHLRGRSGYLVPKPVQGLLTAVSFGSEKWAHWRPDDGSTILRASLGRDGRSADHLDDTAAVDTVISEASHHVGADLVPTTVRVSRWPAAFPQYRPHHHRWVGAVEEHLPPGIHVAGASYRGIGLPACVRDARRVAGLVAERLASDVPTCQTGE